MQMFSKRPTTVQIHFNPFHFLHLVGIPKWIRPYIL